MLTIGKVEDLERTVFIGQDLNFTFGNLRDKSVNPTTGVVTYGDPMVLSGKYCSFEAIDNNSPDLIDWNTSNGKVASVNDFYLKLTVDANTIKGFGERDIKGTLFLTKAVNAKEPLARLTIKIRK